MSTRIERDSLGEVHVPSDAYYGVQTTRALANFQITGMSKEVSQLFDLYNVTL